MMLIFNKDRTEKCALYLMEHRTQSPLQAFVACKRLYKADANDFAMAVFAMLDALKA